MFVVFNLFFRYTLPSRNSVVKMISVKKTQMEEKLKRDIIESKGIAVTHDGWTSINTESYGTVTAHFIDKEWRLKSAVLETRKIVGSHTGEAIAENLRRAQKEWSLPSQPTATTDNAANEIKAFEHLQWTRFGCFGHRINLAVKKALSIPELSKMLSKGRKLVTYYHQSSSATDVLKDKQLLLFDSTTTLKLIQDVPTRWNSTLDMLDRLLKLTPAIMAMATDSKSTKTTKEAIKNYSFNFQEQSVLQQIVDVLSPYKKATTILCADTYPTMQKVIPVLLKLDQSTGIHEDDSEVLKKIKNILRDEMKKRSQDRDIPLLACLLNPGTKHLEFLSEEEFKYAKALLEEKAAQVEIQPSPIIVKKQKQDDSLNPEDMGGPLPNLSTFPEEEGAKINEEAHSKPFEPKSSEIQNLENNNNNIEKPQGTKRKMKDMEEWLDDVIFIKKTTSNRERDPVTQSKKEVENYLNCELSSNDETILEWWRDNEIFFPQLAIIAKQMLAIPASSVSSERVFSLAGNILSKKRSRLTAANVDTFIFINKNMSSYW